MIRVDAEEERYRKVIVLTLDEDGVKGLVRALSALPHQPVVKHMDLVVKDYTSLRVQFEPKAEREQQEREEAERNKRAGESAPVPSVQPSAQ